MNEKVIAKLVNLMQWYIGIGFMIGAFSASGLCYWIWKHNLTMAILSGVIVVLFIVIGNQVAKAMDRWLEKNMEKLNEIR